MLLRIAQRFLEARSLDWKRFKALETPDEMIAFCIEQGLRPMGESNRVVFALNSSKVLKIAKRDALGRDQNLSEAKIASDSQAAPVLTKVFDYDPEGWWLVAELVRPLKSVKEWQQMMGGVEHLTPRVLYSLALRNFHPNYVTDTEKKELAFPRVQKLVEPFTVVVRKHLVQELGSYDHWGKTSDGRLVVLDYGYQFSG